MPGTALLGELVMGSNSHSHVPCAHGQESHDLVMWLFPTVMWPVLGGQKIDYVIRSHDQIPTVMWPVLVAKKWSCKQVTWSGHVIFPTVMWPFFGEQKFDYIMGHMTGHVTFFPRSCDIFGEQKIDYIIKSHDQIPTVMWPGSYGQVGYWHPQSRSGN